VNASFSEKAQGNPSTTVDRFPALSVGVIRADEAYTLDEFKRRVGFQSAALRRARRAGLRLLREGKRKYVLGRDWIDYLLKTAGHQDAERGCGHA